MQKSIILFFDGECNLCNKFIDLIVNRLIENNLKSSITITSLQGETAQKLKYSSHLNEEYKKFFSPPFYSLVVKNDDEFLTESEAIRIVLEVLPKKWWEKHLLSLYLILPMSLKNYIYRIISKNRLIWFGKKQTCRIPSEKERSLFLP